ncbi:MAG: hypothetical protein M3N08_10465 [Pseudomonadota bacterium]|nr:hypothetical protein [Pseudomonadota bacterium]
MTEAMPNPRPGWETDADRKDHPTYPMRQDSGQEHKGMSWKRPSQQEPYVEILRSNERPNLSAVFGSTVPPQGLSGMLRRLAFRYSESDLLHWVPLMLADRVQVIEGILDDLRRGHVPNIPAEMGIRSTLRHRPERLVAKVALAGIALFCLRIYWRGGRDTGTP